MNQDTLCGIKHEWSMSSLPFILFYRQYYNSTCVQHLALLLCLYSGPYTGFVKGEFTNPQLAAYKRTRAKYEYVWLGNWPTTHNYVHHYQ